MNKLFLFIYIGCFACCAARTAVAQTPNAPIVIDAGPSGCVPTTEICGDGIDQNCDGVDMPCGGSDSDRDGYGPGADCDDNDRLIYPGIAVECSTGSGSGYKTCQSGGTYTSCATGPLCEKTGTGRCFYISALTGSDSNAGTYSSPWKTYRNIFSYYSSTARPAKWTALIAGDVIYFMSGLYTDVIDYNGVLNGLYLRGVNGTASAPVRLKAYPGSHPVFAPSGKGPAISIFQCKYVQVEGIEVTRAWSAGVRLAESSNLEIKNSWIHDVDGVDNDNIAGLYMVGVNGLRVHHSTINDNYDRTNSDTGGTKTQNSRNVVLFSGGNVRIDHSTIFQTPPTTAQKTGTCVTYKHSANVSGSIFEVDHNVLWNCWFNSIGSGSYGSRIHHNVILNSDPIRFADYGGTTHNEDNIVEKNTIVGGAALEYNPTLSYGPIGLFTFRNNIVVDNRSYTTERGIVTIYVYGTDTTYNATVPNLRFGPNCYYNASAAPQWNLFNANGGAYGTKGAIYSFSSWKGLNFDTSSYVTDPQLDARQIPSASQCTGNGWLAP